MTSSNLAEHHRQDQPTPISKVVLVGHCGFDQASIGRAVASALSGISGEPGESGGPGKPGVAVESVYDSAGLDQHQLSPASHQQWLVRMIQNLVRVFDRLGQRDDMAAMLEMRELVLTHTQGGE